MVFNSISYMSELQEGGSESVAQKITKNYEG
jgi:hypothetical protein